MKFEKINDNQIRCTLTKDDLISRKIKLNELTYGSEKARNLFFDMINQANAQLGFDVNGVPLMIEAIPTANSLILNITKVSDPEELDTRFSSFSAATSSSGSQPHITGADGILNLLKRIKEIGDSVSGDSKAAQQAQKGADSAQNTSSNLLEAFRFVSLDDTILAAKAASADFAFVNSLYKYDSSTYLLIIHSDSQEPESFNRVFNVLSEYGFSENCTEATEAHLKEHGYLMIQNNAIQQLKRL